jgi:hypothetical protein
VAGILRPFEREPLQCLVSDVRFISQHPLLGAHPIRQRTLGRSRRMGVEAGIVAEQRGAIGTYDLGGVAHVQVDVGMIERRHLALAHEFARADLDHRDAGGVVEVRNDPVRHAVRPLWCAVLAALGAVPEYASR